VNTDPVLGILIPDHSHDPMIVVGIDRIDGGLTAITEHLEGEPEELDYPGRRDVIAFVREDGNRSNLPWNLRATRILRTTMHPGQHVQGPCVIAGQTPDGGIGELPIDVTVHALMAVHRVDLNA
jgi:hypothetical protein